MAEVCGGAARVSLLATRRRLKTGETVDLLTGSNLNKSEDQMAVWAYIERRNPLVIAMAPTCTPFVPFPTSIITMLMTVGKEVMIEQLLMGGFVVG